MKKNLLFIVLLMLGGTLAAQPDILGTYFPVPTTSSYQVFDDTGDSLFVPSEGANQTWDYSNSFVNDDDTALIEVFSIDNAAHNIHFPAATHGFKFSDAPFWIGDSAWHYIRIDTTGMELVGVFSEKQSIDTNLHYTNFERVSPFVFSDGYDKWDTSYYYSYGTANNFPIKKTQRRIKRLTYSGHGTLTTPLGTFTDVVLAKEKHVYYDSVWVDTNFDTVYDTVIQEKVNVDMRYHFFRNNTFATTYLMFMLGDTAGTSIDWGWYTLPSEIGSIAGHVTDSSGADVIDGEVFLYRDNSNFTKNDILARTTLDVNGNYQLDSIPYGQYRIAVRADDLSYPGSLTTYHGDTTDWASATTVTTNTPLTSGIDISLEYAPGLTANNVLTGNVTGLWGFSFNKKGETVYILGEPVSGINVSLEQIPGGAVAMQTETDQDGNFSLPNAPDGQYELWVDIPGMDMSSTYTVTLSGNTVSNLDFVTDLDSIYAGEPTGILIQSNSMVAEIGAFPNPFEEHLSISISANSNKLLQVHLHDVLGNLVSTQIENISQGLNQMEIATGNLNAGIYFVSVMENSRVIGKVKVIKQ